MATSSEFGNLQARAGRLAEAIESYERAVALEQKLADENPSVTGYQSSAAAIYHDI